MCGIFGCVQCDGHEIDIAQSIFLGLEALQHRGQEGAGIVVSDGHSEPFRVVKENGLVSNAFNERNLGPLAKGIVGVGHTRYSTAGVKGSINCIQPFVVYTMDGLVAVAHNGELVNAKELRGQLLQQGVGLSTDTDSEVIAQLLAMPNKESMDDQITNGSNGHIGVDWMGKIKQTMSALTTSYSLIIMTKDTLFAVRDPYGNRPLSIGKIMHGKTVAGYIVASETCSFNAVEAQFVREVEIGEIVKITSKGIGRTTTIARPSDKPSAFCIFEYVYFAKADSIFRGQQVSKVRFECGIKLALEAPVNADIVSDWLVSTVPDSGTAAAHGYSFQTGIPYMDVLSKNHYVGRTFIQPTTQLRQVSVRRKFGVLHQNFKDRRVVLIDDSIVRGTTMRRIVRLLKENGATEVHIRVASPPVRSPCYMGMNIPTKEELIANLYQPEELSGYFGADSVKYLSKDGLVSVVGNGQCDACLSGKYPVDLNKQIEAPPCKKIDLSW